MSIKLALLKKTPGWTEQGKLSHDQLKMYFGGGYKLYDQRNHYYECLLQGSIYANLVTYDEYLGAYEIDKDITQALETALLMQNVAVIGVYDVEVEDLERLAFGVDYSDKFSNDRYLIEDVLENVEEFLLNVNVHFNPAVKPKFGYKSELQDVFKYRSKLEKTRDANLLAFRFGQKIIEKFFGVI